MKKTVNTGITMVDGTTVMVNGEQHNFESKSKMFLFLYDQGMSVGEISALSSNHYSFVYGVVSAQRKIETRGTGTSKSDEIRGLFDQGLTPGQISHELNSNYSFVHSVIKKYKTTKDVVAQ